MKRKLALLLAGTMVLSTVSTNTIFAANGEVVLVSNMQVSPVKDKEYTAELQIGDGNQTFTTSSAFTLELVNGTWVDSDEADEFDRSFVNGSKYNTTVAKTNDGKPNFVGKYKVTDVNQPTYVKVTSVNVSGFQQENKIQLTNPSKTGSLNVTVTAADTIKSISEVDGAKVTINSDTVDGIKAGDKFTLTLPSGYTFDSSVSGVGVTVNNGTGSAALSNSNRTMTITIDTYTQPEGAVFGGVVNVTGLNINNTTSDFNKDVNVTVKKGTSTIAEKKIARFNSYGISAEITTDAKEIPTLNAGVKSLDDTTSKAALSARNTTDKGVTAKVKISENIPNSFRGGDLILTLPKGVTVTAFKETDGTDNVADGYTVDVLDSDNKNVVVIKGLSAAEKTEKLALEFQLEIQTGASFEGDVTATLAGGKNTVDVIQEINVGTIAKVKSVVSVKTEVKDVLAGYTNQAANDIVISEKEAGTFESGEKITIALTDGFGKLASNFGFTKADVEATAGVDFSTKVNNNNIVITIEDINTDKPITFTVKNVQVYSDRNVPTYNGSDAVKYSVTSTDNLTVAATGNYIKFVSELSPDAAVSSYNNDVKITLNGGSATLADGTKVDLYGAPYISADGNYMAPVKGFAYALGLQPEDIVFDSEAKIATFFLADGSVAQVQAGNKYATVNGQNIPLIDANGNIVTPVIKEGRFYLPLRACAKTIFGVNVDYNATDKSVVLNPSK